MTNYLALCYTEIGKHQPIDGIWKDDLYMQTLNQDIKDRTFKPVYLLFGEEAFLKKSYKSRLREALTDGDTMNYNYFEGKGMNVNEIIGLADTMPFFSEKRLILMEDSGFFKGGAGADELTEYMGGIPESTCLVFVESEVDKRSRLYKAVKKYGYAAELSHQEPAQLARWAAGILSKNGRKITGRTMEFFLSKAGDDMENISSELEKLISYTLGREVITDEDVETICTTQVTNKIFDMITAIAARQTRKAMDLYEDLLTLKEPPMRILYLLTRQFRILMEVKEMDRTGVPPKEIAAKVGIMPFLVGKYRAQAKAFTRKELRGIVEAGVQTEEDVKTGKMGDILSVELFLVQYSSKREK